ncbi:MULTISPECIES: PKD domain-containing protein [unclassified Wenzhouxiangella]|uniref:PKD domain-containing protein n=1 Tax=unclassified Wenzhouxiangella TaxID=2613841 RepID=UPI000E328191|nr:MULTISPECIES: PKD domain-containing protein [unclassified Wenzhouxiangella]RFF27039.1 PKD domain-containing protein [Wenzhouxiangella sp. 15181]RFP67544.1 PKD domain-containing protein [Wenzhouxiangella sp. 15190]
MKHAKLRLTAVIGAVGLMFCTYAMGDDNRYIIQFAPGQAGQGVAAVKAMGGDINIDLTDRSVNAIAATLPEQALNGLQSNPNVLNIEEDSRVYPMAETVPYGITMVQADQLSDADAGGKNVCIIDSGYHAGHFDLEANPVNGLNLSGSGDPFTDSCGHGTHVAGTIAAVNNGDGVIGVMPGANINLTIAKVFGDDDWTSGSCGWSYSSSTIQAAYECADAGADVINMSLGGSTASSTAEQGFQDLLDQGVLSIAAAGNDGTTGYSYPASYDAVVSVAAIDDTKTVADFSQKNDQVELAGPGVGVLSTVPTISATAEVAGTSYTVSALDGSESTTGSGSIVDGGLCDSAGSWSGNVVMCERGSISFGDKVANVESGGGSAAIIYNNEPGSFLGLIECNGPSWRACSAIPAVTMNQSDGQFIVGNELGSSATVSTVATAPADGYDSYDGTSMATPHVVGVAALVWSQVPTATATEIRAALAATAEDLGSGGRDNSYGYGLVQAADAVAYLGGGGGGGNTAPTASFTYSCTDLSCSFDGTGSSDADGDSLSYSWEFGDGGTASGSTASHTYANDGSYTVTLTVSDGEASDSDSQTVTVSGPTEENEAPAASFTSSCTDLGCSFDGSGSSDSDGSIVSYDWDFGDGNTGSGSTTSHSYGAGGTYTVTLTVTDDDGASDTASQSVTVEEPSAGGITLSASGYKERGRHNVDLAWDGAESTNVDIYLDGSVLETTANDGAYTWSSNNRGGATYTFQVCEAGTSTCSDSVTVVF